jgi:hypothetical protein
MKTAIIQQRGRNTAGHSMVRVICPTCDRGHWLPADQPITSCPRRPKSARYTITMKGTR